MRLLKIAAVTLVSCVCGPALATTPFTAEAMMSLARIDDTQLSPDGKYVAFTVQTVDLERNTKPAAIYIVPTDGGAEAHRLSPEGANDHRPRWSSDGTRIAFISDRANGEQIWSMRMDGSDAKALTSVPTGADEEIFSPDGKLLLFTSDVYPKCSPEPAKSGVLFDTVCNREALGKEEGSLLKARAYESLLYRHWTSYSGQRRRHILLQTIASGEIRDMTPGPRSVPPFSLGGPEQMAFSPDSQSLAYVDNTDSDLSGSTNSDIFLIQVSGGEAKRLTENPGADEGPSFSPDGKYLAYRTQTRAGFESDQWRLAVLDLSTNRMNTLSDTLDRWVESYTWSHDSQRLFFTINDHGTTPLMMTQPLGGAIRTVAQGPTTIGNVQFSSDDRTMIFTEQSGSKPTQLKKVTSKGGASVALTHLNDAILIQFDLPGFEKVTATAEDGTKVDSFLLKPSGFNPSLKYPVLFAIHGGPQGDWGESWSYRWNPQVFAAAGYVVVLPNPRGSIGYGQAFTDAVSGDWGGKAYGDLMSTVDQVCRLPYVDKNRLAAAGASYGGYMIDWILGHTDRFRALVTHAGVYDLASEAGTTDELWFAKWEFQGLPWDNPEQYAKWSPSSYVANFKTPTLVTQGEIDFRVPIGQSQELFTALQERKIPSKLLLFPDEGHWIVKPQNTLFWYQNVIAWLNKYDQPEASANSALIR